MLLPVDMVVPGIRILKLHLAGLAVENRLGLQVSRIHRGDSDCLSKLFLHNEVAVHWLKKFALLCCYRLRGSRGWLGWGKRICLGSES